VVQQLLDGQAVLPSPLRGLGAAVSVEKAVIAANFERETA
jgi:hypothetical protein